MAQVLPREADFVLRSDRDEEELPRPAELDAPWLRRVGRPVAYLLAVGVAGACLVHGRDDDTAARTRPVAQRSATSVDAPINDLAAQGFVVGAPARGSQAGQIISDDLSDACPAQRSCVTSTTTPPGVAAALRATFPHAAGISVRTVRLADGSGRMLARIVHAATPRTAITVEVRPGRQPRRATLAGSGPGAIAEVQRPVGTMTVRVTAAGDGARTRVGADRLAVDPRVLTP